MPLPAYCRPHERKTLDTVQPNRYVSSTLGVCLPGEQSLQDAGLVVLEIKTIRNKGGFIMRLFMTGTLLRRIATLLVLIMGPFSLVPRVEAGFIGSDESAGSLSREKELATVQRVLEHKMVKERLQALGYTDEEIKARLDGLSDTEIHSFAAQLDSLTAGGDGLGLIIAILVIIILVIIILKLMDKKVVVS